MDEKFEADIGGKGGNEGDGELDGEFEKRAEAFFVVPEAEDEQCEDTAKDDDELVCSADEAGCVNGDGLVECQSAWLD